MLKNKKLVKVVILSLGVIVLLAIIFLIIKLNLNSSNNNYNKKPISWAQTVVIDPMIKYPVIDVIDGDTIKTKIDNYLITIRLLGINTPEVVDPRKSVECFGPEASKETKLLLNNQNIYIQLNKNYERTDKYGRLLAYIWLATTSKELSFSEQYNPTELLNTSSSSRYSNVNAKENLFENELQNGKLSVNEFLIIEGYAREYTYNEKNPYEYQKQFKIDEALAQSQKIGLWSKCSSNL